MNNDYCTTVCCDYRCERCKDYPDRYNDIDISKEIPEWCPLKEVRESKGEGKT